jgi:hypothetical protein
MAEILKSGRVYSGRRRGLWRAVWQQFFGSDIESGYSYIYTWLANQFGHFMIGFAGTIAVAWIFALFLPSLLIKDGVYQPWPVLIIAVLWLLVWVSKEVGYDIASGLRDLRFAERQRAALLADPPRGVHRDHRFLPNRQDLTEIWATLRQHYVTRRGQNPGKDAPLEDWYRYDLVRDSQMDGWFYLSGILTALTMYLSPGLALRESWPSLIGALPLLTFVLFLLLSARLSEDWLWSNIAFDKAQLLFVRRFALNGRPPDEKTRQLAIDFATSRQGQPGHLVIIGPPKSGRTTTAVALGVEALLRSSPPGNIVVYTTLCKLLDLTTERANTDQQGPPGSRPVWPPREAQLLIVDDVGAQGANDFPLVTAEAFKAELQRNRDLRAICDGKWVIWVVGDDPKRSKDWVNTLNTVFQHKGFYIEKVELLTTIPPHERSRRTPIAA